MPEDDCVIPVAESPDFTGSGYTWEALHALEENIRTGVRLVRTNNGTTEFQSATQMLAVKNDMLKALREKDALENPCHRRRAFRLRLG